MDGLNRQDLSILSNFAADQNHQALQQFTLLGSIRSHKTERRRRGQRGIECYFFCCDKSRRPRFSSMLTCPEWIWYPIISVFFCPRQSWESGFFVIMPRQKSLSILLQKQAKSKFPEEGSATDLQAIHLLLKSLWQYLVQSTEISRPTLESDCKWRRPEASDKQTAFKRVRETAADLR